MNKRTPISDLKIKAKEQLLGNYGIAIGSFVVIFALVYIVTGIVAGAIESFALGDALLSGDPMMALNLLADKKNAIMITLLSYIIAIVLSPICMIFATGFTYVCMKITCGKKPVMSDVFFVIKNHPDKVIIISLITCGITIVTELPSLVYEYFGADLSGRSLLISALLQLAGAIVAILLQLSIALSYYVYLEDTETSAIDCVKKSMLLMKGNKWRYFYMLLSFAGYVLLILLSFGIASLWVIPYMETATANFYFDVRNAGNEDENI